jgi:thermitase
MPSAVAFRRRLLIPLAAIGTLFALSGQAASAPVASGTVRSYAANQLLVKFRAAAGSAQIRRTMRSAGVLDKSVIDEIGVHVVRATHGGADQALTALRKSPTVVSAERDAVLKPQEVLPNDPYFLNSGAWNLGGGAWGWYATHTTQAWDITKGDPAVQIAILDTGIKPNGLADFSGRISSTWNVLNNTSDATSNAGDHGTYVAGVASLAVDNGSGNAGYCPNCGLMVVQVGTDSGATLSNLASGLIYAADHGARIANMSWAGSSDSATLQSAINYAHNKGMVIFAAAGNSNCSCVTYPAADQNVLGVAGVSNATGDKQGDSNYGSWVKLAAPEGNMTAWPTINGAPGYAAVGGTSMAAPAAAGIAGLLVSYNPALTNSQLENALESSSAPVNFTIGYGRVDALAALRYVGATDPQVSSAPVQTSASQIYYQLNGWTSIAPLAAPPQVGQVLVRGIGGWAGTSGLSVSGLQWQRCNSSGANCTYLTSRGTYTVQSADAGYAIKLLFSVQNSLGSVPVTVVTQLVAGSSTIVAPVNLSLPTISGTAQDGQTLNVSTGAWTGSPTSYAYQWVRCDTAGTNCMSISAAASSSYLVQTVDAGSMLAAIVTAFNGSGSTAVASAPTAIVASAPAPLPGPSPTSQTVTFTGSLNPKNTSRTFGISAGAGAATAQLSFSKCNTLSIALDKQSGGSDLASASGPSVVTLTSTIAAGNYSYVVSGGRCSFTLVLTTAAP